MAVDLIINQGETYRLIVTTNLDLTGANVAFQLRTSYGAVHPAVSLIIGSGLTVPVPSNGTIYLDMTNTQTSSLSAPRRYVGDMEVTMASGDVIRIVEGTWTTTPEVTR